MSGTYDVLISAICGEHAVERIRRQTGHLVQGVSGHKRRVRKSCASSCGDCDNLCYQLTVASNESSRVTDLHVHDALALL